MRKQCFDQLGCSVEFNFPPQRIISLVPSQTELLFDLGLGERVLGITKFCVHPAEWLKSKVIVGGTKDFKIETIDSLNPDLIIGNKEENTETLILKIAEKFPVWMSNITDWESAMQMINNVGELVNEQTKANALANEIENRFKTAKKFSNQKVIYLIWRRPWMAAGKNTFIDAMMKKIELNNIILDGRYPELTAEKIRLLNPELVLLSSEPYPFKEKHVEELRAILPHAEIELVDGEIFSWYGSRLLHAPKYFSNLNF